VDDLWATKSEDVGLIVRTISFQDFQPMGSWSTNVTYTNTGSSVTVTQCFHYSAYPVLGCYLQFPLLDISRYSLLHNVSYTRRFQWKALLAFLLKHSITRRFNYSTFQRPHRF